MLNWSLLKRRCYNSKQSYLEVVLSVEEEEESLLEERIPAREIQNRLLGRSAVSWKNFYRGEIQYRVPGEVLLSVVRVLDNSISKFGSRPGNSPKLLKDSVVRVLFFCLSLILDFCLGQEESCV